MSHLAIVYQLTLDGRTMPLHDSLFGTPYFGQAVRLVSCTPEELMEVRFKEHANDSKTKPREIGLRAAIVKYGVDAFTKSVVAWRRTDDTTGRIFANEWEAECIADNGGPLRDFEPDEPLFQTLNLTDGGQWGDPADVWKNIQAGCNKRWAMFTEKLDAFVAEHGHARVPRNAPEGLGKIVNRIRCGQMLVGRPDEAERRKWLESKPDWSWNTQTSAWEEFQEELLAFVQQHGHARPSDQQTHRRLAQHVKAVRQGMLLNGKKDEAARRAFLESLPGWSWNIIDDRWETFKAELEAFVAAHGHTSAPQQGLGYKIAQVRSNGTYLKGVDAPSRRAFLESLPGWTWNARKDIVDKAWWDFKEKMTAFVAEHGHSRVPVKFPGGLGSVLHSIRSAKQMLKGHVDEGERRQWLEALPGFTWNRHDDNWEKFIDELNAFVAKHGHAKVPYSTPLGKKVQKARGGRMSSHRPDRRAILEAIPGWQWSARKPGSAPKKYSQGRGK